MTIKNVELTGLRDSLDMSNGSLDRTQTKVVLKFLVGRFVIGDAVN